MNSTTVRIAYVKVELFDAEQNLYAVHPIWDGVDRREIGGWVVHQKYLKRLEAAIRDGAVYGDPTVSTDIYGETYVSNASRFSAKYPQKSLTEMGY